MSLKRTSAHLNVDSKPTVLISDSIDYHDSSADASSSDPGTSGERVLGQSRSHTFAYYPNLRVHYNQQVSPRLTHSVNLEVRTAVSNQEPFSGNSTTDNLSDCTGISSQSTRLGDCSLHYNMFRAYNAVLLEDNSPQFTEQFQASMSTALHYCSEVLMPCYYRILALLGWHSIISCRNEFIDKLINSLYFIMILLLLFTGYILQYASCFRQDNLSPYNKLNLVSSSEPLLDLSLNQTLSLNFASMQAKINQRALDMTLHNDFSKTGHYHSNLYQCRGSFGTYYLIPSLLHLAAFFMMFKQMRFPEMDRFYNLCVLNFMLITRVNGRDKAAARLRHTMRHWGLMGLFCLSISVLGHTLHLFVVGDVCFTFAQPTTLEGVQALKVICLFLFTLIDLVCIVIFVTYALNCQMNIIFLKTNLTSIREKRIDFQDFTKNAEETKHSIDFLNNKHSVGVSILMVHFATRLVVAIIDIFSKHIVLHSNSFILAILSVVLWLSLVIIPLVQAARVTGACRQIRFIGHELRARPFPYRDSSPTDLDSLLAYTSTLHLSARIIMIPVRASCVTTIILAFIFIFLILGQINVIDF